MRLVHLADQRTWNTEQQDMLKVKAAVPRQGGPPKRRKGSTLSASGKTTICGFCKNTVTHGGNATQCPKKQLWGRCFKRSQHKQQIEDLLEEIVTGKSGYPNVTDWSILQGKPFLSAVPNTSKRIQIKGYVKGANDDYWYFLCTCITSSGDALWQREGTKQNSYTDVFIRKTAVNSAVTQFDYVFFSAAQNIPCFETKKVEGGNVSQQMTEQKM